MLNAWLKERLRSETPGTIRKQLRANVIAMDIPADIATQPFLKIEKHGPVPVQAYVAPPRDAIKGVIYGVSTEFTDEDIRATIRPLQGGPKILNAYRLGKSKQAVFVVLPGNISSRVTYAWRILRIKSNLFARRLSCVRTVKGLVTRRTFAHMKHDVADAEEHTLQAKSAPLRNHAVYIAKVNMLRAIPAARTTNANYSFVANKLCSRHTHAARQLPELRLRHTLTNLRH